MLENENLNETQKPQLNIGAVKVRFIYYICCYKYVLFLFYLLKKIL